MGWNQSTFDVAAGEDVGEVSGWTYNGCGLFVIGEHIARDVAAQMLALNEWSLTHLGTGHQICRLVGIRSHVFTMAREIADCTAWEAFSSLKGWNNTDPTLNDKIGALYTKFRGRMIVPPPNPVESSARFIANKRDG